MPGQNVCICATAIERTDKVVRTLRRAGGRCLSGERRTNSSVGRESTRTTTRQCNYRYRDAKAASCMCLMRADGDKQRGCTNFWSFVVLQHGRAVRFVADLYGIQFLPRLHVDAERTGYFPDEAEDYAPDVSLQGRIPRRYALQFFWPSTAPCKSPRARVRRIALTAG